MTSDLHLTRTLRFAAYLAIFLGVVGVLSGLAGAGTFIPYRTASTFQPNLAELLTVVSALGAAASVLGVVGGWAILRSRTWGWTTTLGAAVASIGLNAVITVVWSDYLAFLVIVAVVFGLEILLLLVARVTSTAPPARAMPT